MRALRNFIKRLIFPSGSTVKILRGPLRGYRYVVNDYSGWSHIIGGWEPDSQKIFQKYVKPGDVVFDIGANTGMHSLLFSKLTGAAGKVYAFEPLAANARLIKSVIALNHIENITVYPVAVSNLEGRLSFEKGNNSWEGHLARSGPHDGKSSMVEVRTLDGLMRDSKVAYPQFIKIDVEGEESKVLEGFSETIEKCRPVIYVDLHTAQQDIRVGAFFSTHAYRVFRVSPSKPLEEIQDLTQGWPHKEGIWGSVIGFPLEEPL